MSDLILSLPHYHRHIAIYVVQIIDTIVGRMCLLRDLHFDKHLYLTNCLNAHNHNTCRRLAQTGCTAGKWHSSSLVKIAKHKYFPLIHDNRLKFMISVIIVTGKVF